MAYKPKVLEVAAGGTGLATLTAHSIQLGNGASSPTQLAVGASSTVLVGNTGADPSFSATPTVTSITFGAGTALSAYAEGTWTPTIEGAGAAGTTTYSIQQGYYTKIGNLCWVTATMTISAATGTGNATIGGLPFTVKNQTNGSVKGTINLTSSVWAWPASVTTLVLGFTTNTTTAIINGTGSTISTSNIQMTNGAATFVITGVYQV